MSTQLSTAQSVKQNARRLTTKATDKMKLASSAVARGETRAMDVAVIKATSSQFHVVPKEKHIRTLRGLMQMGGRDKTEVIRGLLQRLRSATDWLTALKTLMVFHRLMHDCGSVCLNALAQSDQFEAALKGKSGGVLDMTNFLDTTNIDGRFDYSEWVRAYGRYLDETLDVWRKLSFFAGKDNAGEVFSLRDLSGEELLRQLPVLQKLQQRMMDCKPGGAAKSDPVVQASLFAVLKESFRIYKAVSEGIINLADKFFEMEYLEAQKGLEIYKESIVDNTRLQEYYAQMQKLEPLKSMIQFPKLENLPADFLTQMEEYVKEAPKKVDTTAGAVQPKKSGPLRKGSKAAAQPRAAHKIEPPTHLESEAVQSNGQQDVNVNVAAHTEVRNQPQAQELNLMDLEDLTVADPPASQSAADAPKPSQATGADMYLEALLSPSTSEYTSSATTPAPWPASSPQNFGAAMQSPASFQSGASSFWPQMPSYNGSALPAAPQAPQQPVDSFQSSFVNNPLSPLTDAQPARQSPGSYAQQPRTYAPPVQKPMGGVPMQNGASLLAQGGDQAAGRAQNGQWAGLGQGSDSRRTLMVEDQLANFGGAPRPSSHSTTPSRPAALAPSLAAGLTSPQNTVLAKEAALHDPFADLAQINPAPQVKPSIPLRAAKPDSNAASTVPTQFGQNASSTQAQGSQFPFQF